jgi:hypothetical protein
VLRTKFIPVAVDQHVHRRLKDEEGALFAKVLQQAGRGLDGYSQGVYLVAPDGTLLAFSNTADAQAVRRLVETALRRFDPQAAVNLGQRPHVAVLPSPPDGGLVLDVVTKVLGGYDTDDPRTERYRQSLGRDHLWLRPDEVQAIARGTIPGSVQQRLARYHLVDNTRGEPPMWRADEIRHLEMSLQDGVLRGRVHLETRRGDRGYQAELLGVVETADGRVTRLDIVAQGNFWGEGTYTRGAPPGRFPLAVAFTLADPDCAASKVPPQGARGNLAGYLQ